MTPNIKMEAQQSLTVLRNIKIVVVLCEDNVTPIRSQAVTDDRHLGADIVRIAAVHTIHRARQESTQGKPRECPRRVTPSMDDSLRKSARHRKSPSYQHGLCPFAGISAKALRMSCKQKRVAASLGLQAHLKYERCLRLVTGVCTPMHFDDMPTKLAISDVLTLACIGCGGNALNP
ncbi:hypothetical protein EVAR_43722_1 [Eumeta japonica]|uniref:Uncharacterized protein n=1 Tax=Eumeta variegata TaxID=151549 RepID=A0A4C1Y512_EUMVA|nr:hypothetical protein EVAR_43722_1 [Eumeta japonica]